MTARQAEAAMAERMFMESRLMTAAQVGYRSIVGNVVTPVASGLGLGFNPFNFASLLGANLQTYFNYQNMFAGTRAFLGGNAGVSEQAMNTESFVSGLKAIGSTRSDALRAMQEIAAAARQVSTDMVGASEAVLRFAKATGTNASQMALAGGSALTTSNLAPTSENLNTVLENARVLAGGVSARIAPITGGIQAFREMQIQAGRAVTFDERGVDNATRLMGGFIGLDAQLYQNRPDVAARHFGQMQGMAQGPLLGMAMDEMRRLGRSTDLVDVMAAIQSGDQQLMGALAARVGGNRGLQVMLSMMGVDANFVQKLRGRPGALSAGDVDPRQRRSLSVNNELARGATTVQQRLVSNIFLQMEDGGLPGIVQRPLEAYGEDIGLGTLYTTGMTLEAGGLALDFVARRMMLKGMGGAAGGAARAAGAARGVSAGAVAGVAVAAGAAGVVIGSDGQPVPAQPGAAVAAAAQRPVMPGLTPDGLARARNRLVIQDTAAYNQLTDELKDRLAMTQFAIMSAHPNARLQFDGLHRQRPAERRNISLGRTLTTPDGRVLELDVTGLSPNAMGIRPIDPLVLQNALEISNSYDPPAQRAAASPAAASAAPAAGPGTTPDGGLSSASAQLGLFTRQLSVATQAAERFASQVNAAAGATGSPRGGNGTR